MELLAVKLEKKQNGSTEVYAGKKILGRVACMIMVILIYYGNVID